MPINLPNQALAAVATVAATVMTVIISFVNLTLTKELKTSEFRQAWIDGLRSDLASFFGGSTFQIGEPITVQFTEFWRATETCRKLCASVDAALEVLVDD